MVEKKPSRSQRGKPVEKTPKQFYKLALDLALQKLKWAIEHIEQAAHDPLVKLALSKGLDQKVTEDPVPDGRIEVILKASRQDHTTPEDEPGPSPH